MRRATSLLTRAASGAGPRQCVGISFTFDHRVLDGSGALKFLGTVKQQLETIEYPLY